MALPSPLSLSTLLGIPLATRPTGYPINHSTAGFLVDPHLNVLLPTLLYSVFPVRFFGVCVSPSIRTLLVWGTSLPPLADSPSLCRDRLSCLLACCRLRLASATSALLLLLLVLIVCFGSGSVSISHCVTCPCFASCANGVGHIATAP